MDIKAYISSGILETYALGVLPEAEQAELQQNLEKYPELVAELRKIEGDLENFALLHAENPPEALEKNIRATLFGEPTNENQIESNKIINSKAQKWTPKFWQIAASWAILALSVVANLMLYQNWQKSESKLAIASAQNIQMAQNEAVMNANFSNKLAVIENNSFKKVTLKGTESAIKAAANVYFNANTNEVYLTSLAMPTLPEGKQYQLWAIVNGKPVDAGLILANDSLGKMKLSPNAQAFAISIENIGGSTTAIGPKGAVLAVGSV